MNNTLEEINTRITEAEEWMNSDLENRRVEITATEQNIEKRMKTNDSLRDLWDNIKSTNIHIIWVPEKRKRKEHGIDDGVPGSASGAEGEGSDLVPPCPQRHSQLGRTSSPLLR